MHGREDLHRHLARILTDELRVHLENAAELALEVIRRDMGEVEVNAALIVDAESHVDADLEDRTRCNVARDEVAVCRIHLLEEVPGLAVLVRPDASALTAAGLGHQTVLIRSRNRRRMNLNELRVADMCALLIGGGNRRAVADRRCRAAAEHLAGAARSEHDHVSRECLDLIRVHVLCNNAADDAVLVLDRTDVFPELILRDLALDLPTTHLLIQCVEELLAGRRASKHGALVLLSAEVAQIQHALSRTRKRNAHAVKHLDQLRCCLNHALNGELVSEEVAAVDRIVKVLVDTVMLALGVHAGVHAALCAERMRTLHRAIGKEVDRTAALTDLHRREKTRQTAADDDNLILWYFSHS